MLAIFCSNYGTWQKKLKSGNMEEWVHHEIGGYPDGAQIPNYRIAEVTYTGSFIDNYRQLSNTQIPNSLIEKFVGKEWVSYKIRDSLPQIDVMLKRFDLNEGRFEINNASDLIPILQDKIYKGMSIIGVRCIIDSIAFTRVQTEVRIKTQDLVLRLEEDYPELAKISVESSASIISGSKQKDVNQLVQQVIHGDVTNIYAGDKSTVSVNVIKGDIQSLIDVIEKAGTPLVKAEELAKIVEREKPQDKNHPLGSKAQEWLEKQLKDTSKELWGMGKSVLKDIIFEAIKQYYG